MADTKISVLTDVVTLAAGDKVPVAKASDLTTSYSATMTELVAYVRSLPDLIQNVTTANVTITAGSSTYIPSFFETGSGFTTEIGAGSFLEIG